MPGPAEWLGQAAETAGQKLGNWMRSSETGSTARDFLFSQRSEFLNGDPVGKAVFDKFNVYNQMKSQFYKDTSKSVDSLYNHIKDDPVQQKMKLSDLHASVNQQNPIWQHTSNLMRDSKNYDLDLAGLKQKASSDAALKARRVVFGDHSEHLAELLMPLYESTDPTRHSYANTLLDILSNQFHDTIKHPDVNLDASETKLNVKKLIQLENTRRVAQGQSVLPYDVSSMRVDPVYQKRNAMENFLARRVRTFLAPMIVIPHMSTFFNLSWAPLTAMAKTMAGYTDQGMRDLVEGSGIFGHLMHEMISQDIQASSGLIGSKLGSQYGRLSANIFHNPGFNYLRKLQLHTAGIMGYHATMYWAEQAASDGDRLAIAELKEMGLDVQGIIRRGGQLSSEEKMQGIWHFANNRVFVDRALDRSLGATRNPWTRMLTMFHGYVTDQQAFLRNELSKRLDAGDYVSIARFAGTLGLLFPAVAPMIASAEVLGRTASPTAAGQELKDKYTQLVNPKGVGDYLDLLSYYGSFGIWKSFINAAHNDRLALAVLGPIAGSAVRTAQDVINFASPSTKSGKRNIRPLGKDILQQTIPGIGNIAANRLLPSRK
jgi:hypothetical protein